MESRLLRQPFLRLLFTSVLKDFVHSVLTDMHDLRLIHTDLKPENILLVSSEYIKIPDYKVITHLQVGLF